MVVTIVHLNTSAGDLFGVPVHSWELCKLLREVREVLRRVTGCSLWCTLCCSLCFGLALACLRSLLAASVVVNCWLLSTEQDRESFLLLDYVRFGRRDLQKHVVYILSIYDAFFNFLTALLKSPKALMSAVSEVATDEEP